jgi:hypothetical protein
MRTAKKTLRCTAKVAGPTCQPAVVRIGTRPVADKWGPSLPCASPPRRTAKTERQVGSLLCCAPDPEAHGKGCGGGGTCQPAVVRIGTRPVAGKWGVGEVGLRKHHPRSATPATFGLCTVSVSWGSLRCTGANETLMSLMP